ncbi:MAG: hypothetical protein ACRC41_14315 [Sarcina sp.]
MNRKKGYILLEVILYIALVGIIMLPVMNSGLLVIKQLNKTKVNVDNTYQKMQLTISLEEFLKSEQYNVTILNNNEVKSTFIESGLSRIVKVDGYGLTVRIYDKLGAWKESITIDESIKKLDVFKRGNITCLKFKLRNDEDFIYEL